MIKDVIVDAKVYNNFHRAINTTDWHALAVTEREEYGISNVWFDDWGSEYHCDVVDERKFALFLLRWTWPIQVMCYTTL